MALLNLSFSQITVHYEAFGSGLGTWTGISVTDASNVWTGGGGVASMNGFGGSDDEDWLVSPAINMDTQGDEYLIFEYDDSFNGALIEVLYSTDYNGGGSVADLQLANWIALPDRVVDVNSLSCFGNSLERHPAIDVSAIVGTNVYYAIKYTGLAANSKSYVIDNIHIEADYYGAVYTFLANGGNCAQLKSELYQSVKGIINVPRYTSSLYDVWDALVVTDRRWNDANNAEIVWDMFTDIPTGTGEFEFDHCLNKDNGSCPGGEGQCYNREHTLPRSWWGGGTSYPADTQNFDLHHITPSDRSMNTAKLNYPPGLVPTATATTIGSNGFKVGPNPAYPCGSKYFEPIDEYKGDYARMFFYMATKYELVIAGWTSSNGSCAMAGNSYPVYNQWMLDVLLDWHTNDPVSVKEVDRNNAAYGVQGNRNPYIDNPQWVGYVWGDNLGNSCSTLAATCIETTSSSSAIACDTYTWTQNSTTYTTTGNYNDTILNAAGCDSVITLNLTINYSNSGSANVIACDSYTWSANSTTYTMTGNYNATLTNVAGCDSVATLNLTINNSNSGSANVIACDSYLWSANSTTYTGSGNFNATLTNLAGCDSVATLNLTINNSNSGSANVIACDSYLWSANSTTYTGSGNFNATLTNMAGCDSVATLNLTINNSNASSTNVIACDTYTWAVNSTTYTMSGNYPTTLTNAAGCDSVITLNLTINNSNSGSANVSACNTYTWSANGTTYLTTGNYTATLTNVNGCDSVATLNLFIGSFSSSSTSVSACNSYTWTQTGLTYTTTGNYSDTILNGTGCDSIIMLDLTVNYSNSGSANIIACDSYTWSANSTTYTANGNYTVTLTNAAGCDSVATLNLTINNSNSGSANVIACDSYLWSANSTTYTGSGNFTATLTNIAGCDSVATLNLTINNSNSGSANVIACDSYLWSANSTTYTGSGNFTATLTNIAGCDSVATLNLTINNSNSGSANVIACDSYLWSANSTTYTGSGNFNATLTNIAGCDSVVTLNLTINNSNSGSANVIACDSYLWSANFTTYTGSGNFTATLTNAAGCDSVATLNLTINNSNSGSANVIACDSYTWSANSTTYTITGNYTSTLTNIAGCDSVATLNLTINTVNIATTSSDPSITASATGAVYQWIDCSNGNQVLSGEISQTFTATTNGDYAVIVTENGCTDTSACVTIATIGLETISQFDEVALFPNPTSGVVTIKFGALENKNVRVISITGRIVQVIEDISTASYQLNLSDEAPGVYFIEIESDGFRKQLKLIKE